MSSAARIAVVVATIVVLVVAFVVLSPGGDDDEPTAARTQAAPPATTTAPTGGAQAPRAEPQPPRYQRIRVRAGKPVGGIEKITLTKGERARIEVSSPDTSDEIHLHGYDLSKDLRAGGRVRFSFDADAEGIFEIELEGAHVQIGQLVVEPR